MIFNNATLKHLGYARILVFGILLLDLLLDNLTPNAHWPVDAFVPHGVWRWVPEEWLPTLFSHGFLAGFPWVYGLVLVMGLVGVGRSWLVTGAALLGTIFFQGMARGFGGHVNHQELIALHALFFLLPREAFQEPSIVSKLRKAQPEAAGEERARLLLRSLTFWVLLTYVFIGMARIQYADWRVYGTNAMEHYGLVHSHKWNWWDFDGAGGVLDQPALGFLMKWSFPFATLLELAAPLALFWRRLTLPIVAALVVFHVTILLTMNIFFWQNLCLLALPVMGWAIDRRRVVAGQKEKLIVFYDATCGLCDGFIRWAGRADHRDVLRFASLEGTTAVEKGVKSIGKREEWTIVLWKDGRQVERSTAVLEIMRELPNWDGLAELALVVPRFFRDFVYRIVARVRYRVFGHVDECEMPPEALSKKLLP